MKVQALANLDAIARVEGVDGVFIGPADLSASMGHLGNASHPDVKAAISDAITKIRSAGKAAGIVTVDEQAAHLAAGCTFVGVGIVRCFTQTLYAVWRSGSNSDVERNLLPTQKIRAWWARKSAHRHLFFRRATRSMKNNFLPCFWS